MIQLYRSVFSWSHVRFDCFVFFNQKLRFRHGSHETHGTWQGQSYNLCLDLDGSSSDDLRPGNVLSFKFLVPIWGQCWRVFLRQKETRRYWKLHIFADGKVGPSQKKCVLQCPLHAFVYTSQFSNKEDVVTIWIIFCWFWLLCYLFIWFLGSTWPVLQPSIQSIYKRSAAKLSLRPAWKARHRLEMWQKFWGRWLERKHERSNFEDRKNWKSQSGDGASFDVKFVVEHRDEKSAWEAAALIPRYHWLRPVALHWCLLRCRQATRPWRAARDVWIFGHNQKMCQKICDLISCDVKVTFDATGLVPGSHYRHGYHKFTNFITHG